MIPYQMEYKNTRTGIVFNRGGARGGQQKLQPPLPPPPPTHTHTHTHTHTLRECQPLLGKSLKSFGEFLLENCVLMLRKIPSIWLHGSPVREPSPSVRRILASALVLIPIWDQGSLRIINSTMETTLNSFFWIWH